MLNRLKGYPAWPSLLIEYLLVAILGYVDYLPGAFPTLIFYIIPISLVALSQGRWGVIFISLASGLTHFVADYCGHAQSTTFNFHSYFLDALFLLTVGSFFVLLKMLWDEEPEYARGGNSQQ